MLLLADLLLLEESLFKGPRLAEAVARRFIIFNHNYILLLLKRIILKNLKLAGAVTLEREAS